MFFSNGQRSIIIPFSQTLVFVALMSTTTLAAGTPSSNGLHWVSVGGSVGVGASAGTGV